MAGKTTTWANDLLKLLFQAVLLSPALNRNPPAVFSHDTPP